MQGEVFGGSDMKQFYNDFKFIIGYMVLTLLVLMVGGDKAERYFLLITLLGMVLINSESITDFLDTNFTLETKESNTNSDKEKTQIQKR